MCFVSHSGLEREVSFTVLSNNTSLDYKFKGGSTRQRNYINSGHPFPLVEHTVVLPRLVEPDETLKCLLLRNSFSAKTMAHAEQVHHEVPAAPPKNYRDISNPAAEGISYYTPKQHPVAGTALSANPPKVFTPIKIRDLTFQNRIFVRAFLVKQTELSANIIIAFSTLPVLCR